MKTKQKSDSECIGGEDLISYLEGIIPPALKEHLERCKDCRKLVKDAEVRTKVM
ncbi:hypothetical protein HYT92_00075 [Candidatus Pacearchaeota archaeon]|nr:hypothetical protein [Candidatus Pacearchaeota archaeon]